MSQAPRLLGAALLIFVAGRCLVPMDETDLFFNLRLGELVIERHAVPLTNVLSFTFPDARDVNLAWVFQIVLALVHRTGGIAGTVLLKTAFVVATFAVLYRVALRRGAHPAAAAAALALAAWAAEPRFVERPHLVTFLGLALTLLALERAEAGKPRALWALVPAGLVWANANSCFFLAPAVLLLYAGGARLDARAGSTTGADARRTVLVVLALAPLVLATPSGTGALSYIANHFRMPSLRPLQEYRTATWPLDGPFFILAAMVVAGTLTRDGRRLRHLLPVFALGLLGARRIRFVAEFALLAGPIAAVALTRLCAAAPRASSLAIGAALVALTLAPRVQAVRQGGTALDLGVEADLVPTEAIRFAEEHGLRARMYNDLEVGSYLTWEGWPRYAVFQDPRINGYPDDFHAILRRADLTRAEWQALLDRFDVTSALISYPDLNPRAALFDPERWALVYRAADGLVFARRREEWAQLLEPLELPVTFAPASEGGVDPRPLLSRPVASTVPDCVWSRRLADLFVELGDDAAARPRYETALRCADLAQRRQVGTALGDLALRTNDPATAVEVYAEVHAPAVRVRRGLALLSLHRDAEALADFQEARAANPTDPDAQLGEALALAALDRPEARAALERFLAQHPEHVGATRARATLVRQKTPRRQAEEAEEPERK